MATTPLRYPGGKAKALKVILPFIPPFAEFREPFVGGGSVFIALKQLYSERKYWINDLNTDLWHFWLNLRDNLDLFITEVQKVKDSGQDGKLLYKQLVAHTPESSIDRAVRFFVLNRITFSGTTESGGYSQSAFEERFTQSSINRLLETAIVLANTTVTNFDYEDVVVKDGKDVFIFLDPPYLSATKSRLYGKNGSFHTAFNHERFAEVMKKTKHRWMITYDDCKEIRRMYSFANIVDWELQYGMNNYRQKNAAKGKELIITNY